jgi:O-methyltransferase involved in polyketide biosynthesis
MPIEVEPRLDGVAETLLWTLRNRAQESKHPGSSFTDPWSVRLYEAIRYDYARFGKPDQLHALRATALDRATRAYLDTHPSATVVALPNGRGVWASRTVRALAARPPLRDRRPSITLLEFAG